MEKYSVHYQVKNKLKRKRFYREEEAKVFFANQKEFTALYDISFDEVCSIVLLQEKKNFIIKS